MTENITQEQAAVSQQAGDEQMNLVKQRKMYERQLDQERQARIQLEQRLSEIERSKRPTEDEDEDDGEPYIDRRKLAKTTTKVKQEIRQETQQDVKQAIQVALEQDRRERWLESNPDFEETMSHADKLAQMDPELARSILAMPDSFERQKMVYRNIKLLGVNKPKAPESTVQQKIDANRKSPFYQPSGVGSAPYGVHNGGFNVSEQQGKDLYNQMKETQKRMRLG